MRKRIYSLLMKPYVIILIILLTASLQLVNGNYSYFFGIFIALIALWSGKFNWSEFGINKLIWKDTIIKALIYATFIFILIGFFVEPLVEIYFGPVDLSSFDYLRGNLLNYLIFILIMWIFAAFGEEFLYRGFFMKRFAVILGDTNKAWMISAIVISIVFGFAHYYQGVSGMLTTGLIGFCFSLIFYKNKDNLTMAMLTHGFYDMIGITLIYINKDRVITDWIIQFL